MDRELADKLHAELGYRSTGLRELSLREWASLRDGDDRFAKTPAEFERLIGKLRSKAYRAKVPAAVRRERAKLTRPAREEREAAKAAAKLAKQRAAHAAFMREWRRRPGKAKKKTPEQTERNRVQRRARYQALAGERLAEARRKKNELNRRWRAQRSKDAKARAYRSELARRKRRLREAKAAEARQGKVHTCATCRAEWCVVPWKIKGVSRFCSKNCQRNAWRERERAEQARKLVYRCHVCGVEWCPIRRLRSLASPDRALCSDQCRADDHRIRQRARARAGLRKRYRDLPADRKAVIREKQRIYRAKKKAAKAAGRRAVNTCARCGVRWCWAPWNTRGASRLCSVLCQQYSAPSSQPSGRGRRDQRWRDRNRATIAAKARAARRRAA